ncbi:ROK family protein [Jatrophihabitans sp. YIM 134969]
MIDLNPSPGSTLRDHNRARLLAAVDTARGSTRSELGEVTGLARSTVTDLVAELLASGALVEADDVPPTSSRRAGRPSHRLRRPVDTSLAIGVDFGHRHCRTGLVDAAGRVTSVREMNLDVDSSPTRALDEARRMVADLLTEAGADRSRVIGVGIGLPAPVDVERGTVGPGNVLPQWVERRPAVELQDALGVPVMVENDANLGVLGEIAFGAALGCSDVVYVKAATGIGAGIVLGGRLHRGVSGRAGEIGHVPVDITGAVCRCGNRGCLETVAATTQVLAVLQPAHDETLTMADVARLCAAGDPGATRVVRDAGRTVGRVLADMVNSLNPGAVVLGGELAAAGAPLLAGLVESLERFAQPGVLRDVAVRLGALGDDAQLVGAGALVLAGVR